MRSAFLDTAEDRQWLRETHLRGVPLPTEYAQFGFAVLLGNEDAPHAVNLYKSADPLHSDDYLRVVFDVAAPVYCEYCEFDGTTNAPKKVRILERDRK